MKHIRCGGAAALLMGLAGLGSVQAADAPIGAPQDWSSRSVVYRQPMTPDELDAAGRSADIPRLYRDPRYVASVLRRIESEASAAAPLASAKAASATAGCNPRRDRRDRHPTPNGDCGGESELQRDWSHALGGTAGGVSGVFPAKYKFDITLPPDCVNDFVVYTTNAAGSTSQATITAFNRLYQDADNNAPFDGCPGAWNNNGAIDAPNVMWSYNTGTGYLTETSPALSYYDGAKQVAFVQRNGNTLQLVLLKWQGGQGTAASPASPTLSASAAAYRACAANCYFVLPFSTTGGANNAGNGRTYSSPYVDYSKDELWVGDGNSRLHKFKGVFQGNPAEESSGFPVAVTAAGLALSSPVSDGTNVYVGSQSGAGANDGGRLHRVNATTGAVASSIKLANNSTTGLRESPILDGGTGSVFAFLFNDGTAGDGSTCTITANNPDACRVIARFATGFANGANPLQRAYVGRGNNANSTLYAGMFDEAYYTSSNGSGAMYIVGGDTADTFVPTLWKIPLNAGAMGTPQKGAVVGSNTCNADGDCLTGTWDWSPVTVIKNGSSEYLYFSMPKRGNQTGCTGACVYMFNLSDLNGTSTGTGMPWGTGNVAMAGLAALGGTGGIIVDNTSTTAGASQVYYAQQGSGSNTYETGTLQVTGNVDTNATLIQFAGRTFAGVNTATNCPGTGNGSINVSSSQTNDVNEIRACLTSAGFQVEGTGNFIIVTNSTTGNVADLNNNSNQITTASRTQGGSRSAQGNAIQASQAGLL